MNKVYYLSLVVLISIKLNSMQTQIQGSNKQLKHISLMQQNNHARLGEIQANLSYKLQILKNNIMQERLGLNNLGLTKSLCNKLTKYHEFSNLLLKNYEESAILQKDDLARPCDIAIEHFVIAYSKREMELENLFMSVQAAAVNIKELNLYKIHPANTPSSPSQYPYQLAPDDFI